MWRIDSMYEWLRAQPSELQIPWVVHLGICIILMQNISWMLPFTGCMFSSICMNVAFDKASLLGQSIYLLHTRLYPSNEHDLEPRACTAVKPLQDFSVAPITDIYFLNSYVFKMCTLSSTFLLSFYIKIMPVSHGIAIPKMFFLEQSTFNCRK